MCAYLQAKDFAAEFCHMLYGIQTLNSGKMLTEIYENMSDQKKGGCTCQ